MPKRKPKPVALAKVLKFDLKEAATIGEIEESKLARESFDAVCELNNNHKVMTVEAADNLIREAERSLEANHRAWSLFTVWESWDHTAQNVRWAGNLQKRMDKLGEVIRWAMIRRQELQPPARVYDLAEYRRFADRVRGERGAGAR
jgi:hypothetical protein